MPELEDLFPAVIAAIPPSLPTGSWILVTVRPSLEPFDLVQEIDDPVDHDSRRRRSSHAANLKRSRLSTTTLPVPTVL